MHSVRLKLGDKQREATEFPKFRWCQVRDWGELGNFNFSLLIHLPSNRNCYVMSTKRMKATMKKKLRSSKLGSTTTHPFSWNYTSLSRAIPFEIAQKGPSPLFRQLDPSMTFVIYRSVPQLIELVNDRLADLYTLAQSEVLDDVRFFLSESMITDDETLPGVVDLRDQSGHACLWNHGHFC